MAEPVQIDLSNYDTLLVQSTQSRAGTPDGNVFFNKTDGTIEFLPRQELAQVDLGSGLEDNPLDEILGIRLEGAYAFENQERAVDEDLRKYDRWTAGTFKFGGAYNFVNGRTPSTAADRNILRGSGWNELKLDGTPSRIYFGNTGLGVIEETSQPYYQLAAGGEPFDYAKAGQINEAVQVFGDATNGDFDSRTFQAVSIRTFGFNYDRQTSIELGIAELAGYATGYAVSEGPHLTTGDFALADVYGAAQIAPWTAMTLEELDTAVTIGGFNEADGTFTWVLNNGDSGTLNQMVAYLDALAQTDEDINAHATNVTNGKRVDTWYTYDALGRIVTRSGADANGLYLYNLPVADQQRVVYTDDAGNTKTYPFSVSVQADVGATAKADANAWYHGFFAADYNTAAAVTIQDSAAAEVKGLASSANLDNEIIFAFDYDGDTLGGTAGTDKNCVFLCEGDGGATQAKTLFTITRSAVVSFAAAPGVETNV